MNLKQHQDQYEWEWKRRDQLVASVGMPVSIVVVLTGALFVMFKDFPYESSSIGKWSFILLSLITGVFLMLAIWHLFRAFHGYSYRRIPTSGTLQKDFDAIREWHLKYGTPEDAVLDFERGLAERYAHAVDVNEFNNKRRAAYLVKASRWTLVAFVFVGSAAIPFTYLTAIEKPPIVGVRIVEEENNLNKEPQNSADSSSSDDQPHAPALDPTGVPPPKPTVSPNLVIMESDTSGTRKTDTLESERKPE